MKEIKRILENQNEVRYLGYILIQDYRTGEIKLEMSTCSITKLFKFKDENSCLNKLIDILFDMKKLEKWALAREDKKK